MAAARKRGAQASKTESKRAVRDRERRKKDPSLVMAREERGKALELAAKTKIRRAASRKAARSGKPPPTDAEAEVEVMTFQAWAKRRTVREVRVDEVVLRMSQGLWLPGVSSRAMAEKWNVTPSVVETVAAEASRVMRRMLRDDDENFLADARVEVLQTFRAIRARALAMSTSMGTPPSVQVASLNVAMAATRLYGFYLGLEPAKGERKPVERENFDDWSTEDLDRYAATGKLPEHASGGGVH